MNAPSEMGIRDAATIIRAVVGDSRAAADIVLAMSREELQETLIAMGAIANSLAAELFGVGGVHDFLDYALTETDRRLG